MQAREDKGDREGIPHTHPKPAFDLHSGDSGGHSKGDCPQKR